VTVYRGLVHGEKVREGDIANAFCNREGVARIDILKTDTEGYDARLERGKGASTASWVRSVSTEKKRSPLELRKAMFAVTPAVPRNTPVDGDRR
jgi:hypothetical protein